MPSTLRKLLMVDDDVDGAEPAATLLRSHGIEVVVVQSADRALAVLQDDSTIDAVLSDIKMPGMTGIELAHEIRSSYPAIKVVLMSGCLAPEPPGNQQAPYLFAVKPYRIDSLLELLHAG